jgi:hypothetical protein
MMLPLSVVKPSRRRGLPAELDQLARDVGASHRDHLDRQRKLAEHADQLAFVGDADELLAASGDDLLARQRTAAALDHGEVFGYFVGAVDIDFQFADAVEVEHLDAVVFETRGGRLRTGDRAVDAALDFGQCVDEIVGGGAGSNPDDAAPGVIDRGTRHGLLHFVLIHHFFVDLNVAG